MFPRAIFVDYTRHTRPSNDLTFIRMPKWNNNYGRDSFQVTSIRTWNELLRDICEITNFVHFKTALKAHYFRKCFGL